MVPTDTREFRGKTGSFGGWRALVAVSGSNGEARLVRSNVPPVRALLSATGQGTSRAFSWITFWCIALHLWNKSSRSSANGGCGLLAKQPAVRFKPINQC